MKQLKLPREEKERIVDGIVAFFEEERGESIGRLAAEHLLDSVIGLAGPAVYNLALADARRTAAETTQRLEEELFALEWRPDVRRK